MKRLVLVFFLASALVGSAFAAEFHYHSRHIPAEHLDLTKYWAKVTRDGGLCDCLEPEKIAQLKAAGVDTIELRLVWWALEKNQGVYDFSRLDRDVAKVEKAGLTPGLMAWLNHPPSWYKGTTFECAVHHVRGSTLSAWDPFAVEIADKIYAATSERYGKRIGYVYVTGSGDYGEPTLPHGVDHYHFSSPHRHDGLGWTGDAFARAAWAKVSSVPVEDVLAGKADRATALAYADFIADRTAGYAADMYRVIRKHFPWARYGHPIGHTAEYFYGQNRARVVKRLCEVSPDITCRWTGLAYYGSFHRSNVIARRVSSACHFYGCAFGEEASTPESIAGKNAANAIYEMIANDTTMIHNDYGNILRSGKENIERAKNLPHEPFVCDVAVLWPEIPEKIASVPFAGRGERPSPHAVMNAFLDAAGEFRKRTDYEICDLGMIADGFLEKRNIRKLVVFHKLEPEEETVLSAFRKSGGSVTDGSEFPPPPDPLVFKTRHLTFTSSFTPETGEIKVEKVRQGDR